MGRDAESLVIAAAVMSMGLATIGEYAAPSNRRRRHEPSLDEVERSYVSYKMLMWRRKQRSACNMIAELAKATGPWAHRYGYGKHPESRAVARRLRQKAAREAKRRPSSQSPEANHD